MPPRTPSLIAGTLAATEEGKALMSVNHDGDLILAERAHDFLMPDHNAPIGGLHSYRRLP